MASCFCAMEFGLIRAAHNGGSRWLQELSPEAIEERKTFLEQMNSEFARVYAEVKGAPLPATAHSDRGTTLHAFMSGATRKQRQEEITGEHKMMMEGILEEEKVQDDILVEMSVALDQLKRVAVDIGDALEASNRILDDATEKVDKTAEKLDSANARMKRTLKKVGAAS